MTLLMALPTRHDAEVSLSALQQSRELGITPSQVDSGTWTLPSQSEPGTRRTVTVERIGPYLRFTCDCPAGTKQGCAAGHWRCWHCASVGDLLFERGLATWDLRLGGMGPA